MNRKSLILSFLALGCTLLGLYHQSAITAQNSLMVPTLNQPHLVSDLDTTNDMPNQLTASGDTLYFIVSDGQSDGSLYATAGIDTTTRQLTDEITAFTLRSFQDGVVFLGYDANFNHDLWRSDGTLEGTYALNPPTQFLIDRLFVAGDDVYFFENSGMRPILWVSDGTQGGAQKLKELGEPFESSVFEEEAFQGNLFFVRYIDNGSSGDYTLWRSDGTVAGTVQVLPSQTHSALTRYSELTAVGDQLFFSASDNAHFNRELWRSDGTAAGTQLVRDINPFGSSAPYQFMPLGDKLIFVADDGTHGHELWVSDGTEAGTMMLKDITAGSVESRIGWTAAGVSKLFFTVEDDLWITDGTAAGTQLVTQIRPTEFQTAFHAIGDELFFTNNDPATGVELWRSDGTAAGTRLVTDLNPNGDSAPFFVPRITDLQQTLFFAASDGTDPELWGMDVVTKTRLTPVDTTISEADAGQGADDVTFNVTLNTVLQVEQTVSYQTVDGSAIANEDFIPKNSSVAIQAGTQQATFAVTVIDDAESESLQEMFSVQLTGATFGVVGTPSRSTIIIINDDLNQLYLPTIVR